MSYSAKMFAGLAVCTMGGFATGLFGGIIGSIAVGLSVVDNLQKIKVTGYNIDATESDTIVFHRDGTVNVVKG